MKKIQCSASPNIAFIKYWGKKETTLDEEKNFALNPSLSMTLNTARTQVILEAAPERTFIVQGQPATPKDHEKISAHVDRIEKFLNRPLAPFLMSSANNFPTGTGIASSASAYAAMTAAFLAWDLGAENTRRLIADEPNLVSALARRGSGSASRSLHGPFVEWGGANSILVHESDWLLFDTIVIFSKKEKTVSSTEGHKYATLSPLFARRMEDLPARMMAMKRALHAKSLAQLGPLLETEAAEMHQIMRENPHPVEYQLPATKSFLQALTALPNRDFFYTLDAGPNVHIISERPVRAEITQLLNQIDESADIWLDQVGKGFVLS